MRPRAVPVLASVLSLFVLAAVASAQAKNPAVDEFGVQDGNDLWIPASSFTGSAGWLEGPVFGYFVSTGASAFHAVLPLPQGAYLDSWTVLYYDGSASNDITVGFSKWYDDTTQSPVSANAGLSSLTSTGSPGFANFTQAEGRTIDLREPLGGSVTRQEAADFYTFYVLMPDDTSVAFKGVRVIWHRQVSPAPATATFNDVPASDPGFQYIEALVASGVTAGCGGGNYCPDANLTRRQMAVFLAKALGLHWPNF